MNKFRWGIISTADIGVKQVIPALQASELGTVTAISSRNLDAAQRAAKALGIPKAYGSYEELLADPEIDGVYNPLPNHLHVPWSIKSLEAGKPVLCEKPLSLDADGARELLAARDRTGVLVVEAFVPRHHPQWRRTREMIREGRIGQLRLIQGTFTYMLTDPANVRNQNDIGGGGVYDIGCYPMMISRYLFGAEPRRVVALVERDPTMKIDRLASFILDYEAGQASFSCATQLAAYQRMQMLGTDGRIEIHIPFGAPADRPCRISIDPGGIDSNPVVVTVPAINQYTVQGDDFVRAARGTTPAEFPLEDAVLNMRVIDAIYRSGETGRWEDV